MFLVSISNHDSNLYAWLSSSFWCLSESIPFYSIQGNICYGIWEHDLLLQKNFANLKVLFMYVSIRWNCSAT